MSGSKLVCIAVCTRARPKMLRACLRSLAGQQPPPGWTLAILVIENDPRPGCASVVEEESPNSSWPIHYAHEPELGIPIARNTAVRMALGLKAGWLAFIDDDEVASPEWMGKLCNKAAQQGVDIVNGPVHYQYPVNTPGWFHRRATTESEMKAGSLATNNVLVRASLFEEGGLGLRFNEGMRYTGGSDGEFFRRAISLGATSAWCGDASVIETVPESRLTLKWQLSRAFRTASNVVEIELQQKGVLRAVLQRVPKNIFRLIGGSLHAPIILLWPTQLPGIQRLGFKGMKSVASALGGLARFFGFRPQPYKQIDGE